MKRLLCALTALLCILGPCSVLPCAAAEVSAACAIVMDADSGRVLYEKNADDRRLIASTTKIMTGYLACCLCSPEDSITVPPEAVGVEGSSIYLQAGETVPVRTLLYGTLLQSGNDAATALAIAAGGSVAHFVELMNQTAQSLGLKDTHYANPHGLDAEDNYSTARDLARLSCAALQNPGFAEVVATRTITIGNRSFVNHNKLLWRYEGIVGVKTGYTRAAGRVLVSALQRTGRTLVCVTIHAPDDWNDHIRLYEEALQQYAPQHLASGSAICMQDTVCGTIPLKTTQDLTVLLLPGETLLCVYSGAPLLFPPFSEGDDAGEVQLLIDGRPAGRIPVCYGASSTVS